MELTICHLVYVDRDRNNEFMIPFTPVGWDHPYSYCYGSWRQGRLCPFGPHMARGRRWEYVID